MSFVRAKRGSDLLDDRARARLVGADLRRLNSDSSGSEHDGEDDDLPCLSELVHGFLEVEPEEPTGSCTPVDCDSDSDRADSTAGWTDAIEGALEEALARNADSYRSLLLSHVSKAVEVFSCLRSNKPALRRNVMSYLREIGYNAAICKTKWDSSGGLTAGSYEFIDVVRSDPSACGGLSRYLVDVDFDGHFAIARPAPEYSRLLQRLPGVFVGGVEDLKRVVRLMCDAARRSLKSRELSLPPWRKNRYMQNKWLAPHRRTTNPSPVSTFGQGAANSAGAAVKCRSVGFDQSMCGRLFVRTR